MHTSIAFLTWLMGKNFIIDFNAFHHYIYLRLLICYTGHFGDNKTVEIISVASCVRSYHLMTALYLQYDQIPSTIIDGLWYDSDVHELNRILKLLCLSGNHTSHRQLSCL